MSNDYVYSIIYCVKQFIQNQIRNIRKMTFITVLFFVFFSVILVYTRTVNLGWGLPYPMHPDERNMIIGILSIKCETDHTFICLNPHFFAYGQLPLFTAYFIAKMGQFFNGNTGSIITYEEAAIALRQFAAFCALLTGLFLYQSLGLLAPLMLPKKNQINKIVLERVFKMISLLILFSPGLIQFAHYGTTESLLMMAYSGVIYTSLALFRKQMKPVTFMVLSGILTGVALASKVSALPFLGVPGMAILVYYISSLLTYLRKRSKKRKDILMIVGGFFGIGIGYTLISAALGLGLSPFNIISFPEFQGSMRYETGVGFGDILVFYTRSFFMTTPVLFQLSYILPFVLGLPVLFFSLGGLVLLPWKQREIHFLRYAFLLYFIPEAFLYAKWTRFIAPVFPVMILFAMLFVYQAYIFLVTKIGQSKEKFVRYALKLLILVATLPGLAYLSVYIKPDVRYVATEWMYKNIPADSYLLAETANVVDIPAPAPSNPPLSNYIGYRYISFDFYNLDTDPSLPPALDEDIKKSDYIIVNSRRVFKNHTCLTANEFRYQVPVSIDQTLPIPDPFTNKKTRCDELARTYPRLQQYYSDLFSGRTGYKLIAEFTSYPDISLFGRPLIEFPDENAEETWAIFDHPVIRIYKRTQNH